MNTCTNIYSLHGNHNHVLDIVYFYIAVGSNFSTVFEIDVFVCHHRALDNQVYAAGVSVARDESASYVSWANSTLVSPW